jgi:hypothetical protein
LYRILAYVGWVAHLFDMFGANRKREGAKPQPYAGKARFGMATLFGFFAVVAVVLAVGNAVEGASNPNAVTYTIDQIVDSPNGIGSRNYATVTGTVYDWMVETTKGDKYDHATYIVGNPETDKWILVQTWKAESDFEAMVKDDGTITVTGMLRSDSKEVKAALDELGSNVPSVNITKVVVLNEGQTPASPYAMIAIALVGALVAIVMFLGWWLKFLPFKPLAMRTSMATQGMSAPISVRATGIISRFEGGDRAFEQAAQLQSYPVDPAAPAPTPSPVDLVWTDGQGLTGTRFMPGVSEAVMGTAWSRRGPRPAIALKFVGKRIVIDFDDEASRDTAFDQLRYSTGMAVSPEGAALRSV